MIQLADAQPFAFAFARRTVALIVIDMQADFLNPGGFGESLGNDVSRLAPAIEPTRRLLDAFRRHGLAIIHTKECHRPDLADLHEAKHRRASPGLRIGDPGPMGRILIAGEPGTEIIPELAPLPGETVIEKPGKGAFYNTPLTSVLADRAIRQLVFAGVTTEICVQTTMREANDRGFDCLLAEDATESYFPAFKEASLQMVRAQGAILGWTASTSAIVAALDY